MPNNFFRKQCFLFTLIVTCITFVTGFIVFWYIILSGGEFQEYWWRIVFASGVTFFVNGLAAALLHEEKPAQNNYQRR